MSQKGKCLEHSQELKKPYGRKPGTPGLRARMPGGSLLGPNTGKMVITKALETSLDAPLKLSVFLCGPGWSHPKTSNTG